MSEPNPNDDVVRLRYRNLTILRLPAGRVDMARTEEAAVLARFGLVSLPDDEADELATIGE